ncbi:glycosyltransferase family 2 protein [Rhodoferax sp.]|uniref:glycosyltransferase n=1 Tax=Rhodoferax sp. TaxID=50421 RepID=UPI0026351018|nr:glycosyltransferase family 2 protein [Rhodoferax sp.]MDD3935999.1 glycosyltransferase [Rhodoferax sp.]
MMGVVVIGRNEGPRLIRCLESVLRLGCPVVYADSNSSDGSVAKAKRMGAAVARLDPSRPMNAARGRKAGFDRLLQMHPALKHVLFLDGDCELDAAFLPAAQAAMLARPEVAVVCGRRRERHPQASVYNRMADLEWNTPVGECDSCGGDALFSVRAYVQAGGFDDTVLAGEEPELCSRIRRQGFQVLRINVAMSWHDMNMHQLSQWWRRGVRTGYGALDVRRRHGVQEFNRLLVSAWVWVLAWPLVSLALVAGAAFSAGATAAGWLALFAVSLLPLQVLRVARTGRQRGLALPDALAYGALMMVNKWACAWGQLKWMMEKR